MPKVVTADNEIQKKQRRGVPLLLSPIPMLGKPPLPILLYGGAIHEAGSVRARKASHHAASDYTIEKERGISVTSSVMRSKRRH